MTVDSRGKHNKGKLFDVRNIKLNYSRDMSDVGKININKIKGIFQVKRQIRQIIKGFKPDIVYFVAATDYQGMFRDWLFVREIRRHWKGQIMFHIRSRILSRSWKNKIRSKILKDTYFGQKAIVLGKELIPDLRGLIDKKNIFVLPNAIKNEVGETELKRIISARKKNKQFNILFLSNMDRTKGWTKVLDACKILNDKKLDFRCDFVGGWLNKHDEDYFLKFVNKNKLKGKVFSYGEKTGKDKNEFLETANVLVFPTEYEMETFGRVIIEAYMYSVPVIANGIATIPTTIQDGKTGFVLRDNSGTEIAEKIFMSKDWSKMGVRGRKKFLDEFEIEGYRERFLELFR